MKVSGKLYGGTANNLFQICAILAYSLKHNIDYCIPTTVESPHSPNQKVFYSPNLRYCNEEHNGIKCFYNEKSFEYNEIPKQTCEYYIINGYFQSWRYMEQHREEIIKILDIPYDFKEGYVFIHHRLGDYKVLGKFHKMINEEYILKALNYFTDLGYKKFLVFSDEINEAEKMINSEKYKGLSFGYSVGSTDVEDLSLMSSCEHGILSASSFSWWGAYLGRNEDRKIVYPREWFGAELSHHNTKDLCPPNWTAL